MSERRFQRWNWEFDYGEGPIPEREPLPARHAIAWYSPKGRLYRVVERVKESADLSDDDPAAFGKYVYDYFCDSEGRVLEKRSLDEFGSVFLIVEFDYDLQKNEVVETAWCPANGTCKTIRRPFSPNRGQFAANGGSKKGAHRGVGPADAVVLVHNAPEYIVKQASAQKMAKATEHRHIAKDFNEARRMASGLSGVGDDGVPLVAEIGPHQGRTIGRMSPDGTRGWQLDFHPNDAEKGFQVNWWDRSGGATRKDWYYGNSHVEGPTEGQFLKLLQHAFGNVYGR